MSEVTENQDGSEELEEQMVEEIAAEVHAESSTIPYDSLPLPGQRHLCTTVRRTIEEFYKKQPNQEANRLESHDQQRQIQAETQLLQAKAGLIEAKTKLANAQAREILYNLSQVNSQTNDE